MTQEFMGFPHLEMKIKLLLKRVFTSCKIDNNCPPWSMKAKTLTHDKVKKNIIYDHAVVNFFDLPVFYFPKFFHPDPTVNRRSGFLQPRLNSSNIVGTSFNLPYFFAISESEDYTFKPTIFDNRIYMFQNEYRKKIKILNLLQILDIPKDINQKILIIEMV